MSWFHKVNGGMMWQVDTIDAQNALEELNRANYQEKAIVAKSDSHHVVFFEGDTETGVKLFEASISPDGSTLNTEPIKTTAGSVDNVYKFSDQWNSISIEETPPIVRS